MNRSIWKAGLGLGSVAGLFGACSPNQELAQPNILFIMSDDHAQQAISAYGGPLSKVVQTPNIDRIAHEGALFRSNYCCNSLSGPSRACIMTGLHSHANGFMRNGNKFDGNQQTIQKILQENGYQTAIIGKWHLNDTPKGFDYWTILHDQGEYYNPDFISEGNDTTRIDGYVTDIITEKCKKWISGRDKKKPFFLMMHHKACHRNWWPAEKNYGLYKDIKFPVPENYFDDYEGRKAAQMQKMNIYRDMYEGHDLKMNVAPGSDSLRFDPWPHLNARMTPAQWEKFNNYYRTRNDELWAQNITDPKELALWKYQRFLEEYMATAASVDESVGEMLDYLKKEGLLDNTIIVYCSDQSFYLGEHGWFDKRFMYEESMSMPLMIRYPKEIKAGTEITELTQNIDFAPSFLDMVGIDVPDNMQGVSFYPLLKGEHPADWRDALYYHFYENPGFHSVQRHYGIKTERYKLMHFYIIDEWELYDLQNDPKEMLNIYGQPGTEEITAQLMTRLKELQTEYKVPERLCKPDPKEARRNKKANK